MEILGIDYGTKRIGLAYADETLGIAVPLPALVSGNDTQKIDAIIQILNERRIKKIVIGYPLNMDDTPSELCKIIDNFTANIHKNADISILKQDERLTSFAAENSSNKQKKSKKETQKSRHAGTTDSKAAAIILQDFLDEQHLKFDSY